MIHALLIDFFTMVPGAAFIGGIFDFYARRNAGQRLDVFLERHQRRRTFSEIFYDFLSVVNQMFFERFFSERFFSIPYFLNTSIISLAFLGLVVGLQFFYNAAAFDGVPRSAGEAIVLGILLLGNLIIDWVSIGLTQTLIGISVQLRNVGQSLLLIFVDIVLTVNMFAFLFAAALTLLLVVANSIPESAKADAAVERNELQPKPGSTAPDFLQRHGLLNVRYIFSYSFPLDDEYTRIGFYSDRSDVSLQNAIEALGHHDGVRIADGGFYLQEVNAAFRNTSRRIYGIRPWSKQWTEILKGSYYGHERLEIGVGPSPVNLPIAYGVSYVASQSVQTDFFSEIRLSPRFVSFGNLLPHYWEVREEGLGVGFAGCIAQRPATARWVAREGSPGPNCTPRVAAGPTLISALISAVRAHGMFANTAVPMNTFFMTSILMTVLVYGFSLFLIATKIFMDRLVGQLSRYRGLVMHAPITFGGILVGMISVAISQFS